MRRSPPQRPRPGHHEAIWHRAAGFLLIEEAGGRVTDIEGRAFDFSTDAGY
jgi:3'(2'), 5'-bisphosphate nucleotidase